MSEFVLSNELVSMALAMVAENPEVCVSPASRMPQANSDVSCSDGTCCTWRADVHVCNLIHSARAICHGTVTHCDKQWRRANVANGCR